MTISKSDAELLLEVSKLWKTMFDEAVGSGLSEKEAYDMCDKQMRFWFGLDKEGDEDEQIFDH
jgi:hypothetical protein